MTAAVLRTAKSRIGRQLLRVETGIRPAPLLGDADLIDRLVANLLDNAVWHNVPGGSVEVRTGMRDGRAVLSVANGGPVIQAADVDRLPSPSSGWPPPAPATAAVTDLACPSSGPSPPPTARSSPRTRRLTAGCTSR